MLTKFDVCVGVKYDVSITEVIYALKDIYEIVWDKHYVVTLEKLSLVIITDAIYDINLFRNVLKMNNLIIEYPEEDAENDKNKRLHFIKDKINLVQEWYQLYKKKFL